MKSRPARRVENVALELPLLICCVDRKVHPSLAPQVIGAAGFPSGNGGACGTARSERRRNPPKGLFGGPGAVPKEPRILNN